MEVQILISNITNPTLLFFVLGIFAAIVRSDLEIPPGSVKFISLYLLFAIGFKGGQELSHSELGSEVLWAILFGITVSFIIPLYTFFIFKKRVGVANAGALAAAFGSVSAVTFVAAVSFLEQAGIAFGGHNVAIMALMEAPAIIVGVVLIRLFDKSPSSSETSLGSILHHSLTNGSVLLLLGSLVIGIVADSKQAEGIKPFTNDIFKGFLAVFLLELGMMTARRFASFRNYGMYLTLMGIAIPLLNGCFVAIVTGFFMESVGDRFMLSILAASASYIAVPASLKIAVPSADPGLYVPMAIGVTFPFNITIGLPLYLTLCNLF